MPHLRIAAVAWLLGAMLTRLGESTPRLISFVGCCVAIAGLALLLARAHRVAVAGASLGVAMLVTPPHEPGPPALFDGKPWDLVAQVDGTPRRTIDNTVVPIALEAVRRGGPPLAVEARLRLTLPRVREALGPSDRVVLRGRIAPAARTCNPGACDGLWRAAADRVQGTVTVHAAAHVMRIDQPAHGVGAALWGLREAMRRRIEAVVPEREALLLAALVLGERGALPAQLEADFRAVGITHLLSVSGLHLAFAAGLLFALVRFLVGRVGVRLATLHPRDRWAALISLPVVLAYAELTGGEVATLRAALVVAYAFGAVICARRLRGVDALSFAALALLVTAPARAFDVSFQLSFVAAWATLVVAARGPTVDSGPRSRVAALAQRAVHIGITLMRVSLAATVATAPLTAWWFSEVAPMGVVSNLVAVPLTELLVVPLGIAGASLSLVWPVGGRWPLLLAGLCTQTLVELARAAAIHAPVFRTGAPSLVCLVVCGIGIVWVARRPRALRLLVAGAFVAAVVLIERVAQHVRPQLEVTFLDVGQGDGCVVVLPDRRAIVIDAGPGQGDLASRTVGDYLARRGVVRIALLVLSHPHPDHAGGLPGLLARFPVDEVWWNEQPNADPSTRDLLRRAQGAGIEARFARTCDVGAVHLERLAPYRYDGTPGIDPLASENDNSLVIVLSYAGRQVLFAGDIEAQGEDALLGHRPARVDVLKVPHHGSRTSSTEALLDVLKPSLAVASLAHGNRYGFPHPEVVARYRARNIPLYRTDRDGAVTVRISSEGRVSTECAQPAGCQLE